MEDPNTTIFDRVRRLWGADDPEAVAAVLREAGARGKRRSVNDCPICAYLRTPDSPCRTSIYNLEVGYRWRMPTPPAVSAFLRRFDDGDFEDLDRGSAA